MFNHCCLLICYLDIAQFRLAVQLTALVLCAASLQVSMQLPLCPLMSCAVSYQWKLYGIHPPRSVRITPVVRAVIILAEQVVGGETKF